MPRSKRPKHKREPRLRDENNDKVPEHVARQKWEYMTNEKFESYYKAQNIMSEEEFPDFMAAMRKELPATFRITGFRGESTELKRVIEGKYFSQLTEQLNEDGKPLPPPQPLPWYPDALAYQLNFSRRLIRKNELLKKLHRFLVSETENGNISRQEAVSMLPPLVLDVKPHHRVLDMCAAPGSKTAQLIEMLHANEGRGRVPEGFVVANDSDNKRCYLLMHQARRMHSPNFLIMNHDASLFPSLRTTPMGAGEHVPVEYDRVLCDVPCSGDGTMRKNFDIWKKWNVNAGHGLHSLQLRIIKRGLELLAPGGRLVYSTCSLNPIENEAVISEMLVKCQGAVELLDVSGQLPGLKHSNGLNTWKIQDKAGNWYKSWAEVPEKLRGGHIRPSSFPPPDAHTLGLERCIRVLPHQQDTGGFFVAVLVKNRHLAWTRKAKEAAAAEKAKAAEQPTKSESMETDGKATESSKTYSEKESESEQPMDTTEDTSKPETDSTPSSPKEPDRKRMRSDRREEQRDIDSGDTVANFRNRGYKEDPFFFMTKEHAVWEHISSFYHFREETPCDQLMYRCASGKMKNIYFVSPQIRNLAICNRDRVKFINMGILAMKRNEHSLADCDFRLNQAGIYTLAPYLNGRRISVKFADLCELMKVDAVYTQNLSSHTVAQMESAEMGSCILMYEPDPSCEGSLQCELTLSGWRGKSSLKALVNKFEKAHIMRLCGLDPEQEIEEPSGSAQSTENSKKSENDPIPGGDTNNTVKDDASKDDTAASASIESSNAVTDEPIKST